MSVNKIKFTNKLFIIFFFCLSMASLPTHESNSGETTYQYLIILIYSIFALSMTIINSNNVIRERLSIRYIDFIPLIFICVWIYGVFIGLLRDIPNKYVFRNFAGMFVYSIYYIFVQQKLSFEIIKKACLFTSLLGIPVIFYYVYSNLSSGVLANFIIGERMIFCGLQLIIFIPFCIAFGQFFFPINTQDTKFFKNNFIILLVGTITFFTSVIMSFSKGMILSSISVVFIIVMTKVLKNFNVKNILYVGIFLLIISGMLYYLDLFKLLGELFSGQEVSNATRNEQSTYIISDLTFWGRGLGAGLSDSNYIRADDAPYAFELTYLNLIHKFGVFSLPLFFSYIYTFLLIIRVLGKSQRKNFVGLLCLGLMVYVFPSIGNPFLFSPLCVTLHCLTLIILKKELYEKKLAVNALK
ncbi:hypothetical protein [Limibacterium fermenti]|uniref:hypothetical protein n=1 Tax=Limibacterium fermenti TaxID=3229863 RepID=UPI003A7790E9